MLPLFAGQGAFWKRFLGSIQHALNSHGGGPVHQKCEEASCTAHRHIGTQVPEDAHSVTTKVGFKNKR